MVICGIEAVGLLRIVPLNSCCVHVLDLKMFLLQGAVQIDLPAPPPTVGPRIHGGWGVPPKYPILKPGNLWLY